MANDPLSGLVPARYVGDNLLQLQPGRYYNADGTLRTSNIVSKGDVLMMPEQEIIGQTILFDPRGYNNPLYLGAGHRVLPEHQGLDQRSLALLGYEHHLGRSDFELVTASQPAIAEPVQEAPAPVEQAPEQPTVEQQAEQPETVEKVDEVA